MGAANLVWVDGVRTSTLLMVVLIGTTHLHRRQWAAALLAPPVFVLGFEVCWRAVDSHQFQWPSGWSSLAGLVVLWKLGYRPNLWWILASAAFMTVWVSSGFHVNYPGPRPDLRAELLNESTKSAWGVAWLLAARRTGRPPQGELRAGAATALGRVARSLDRRGRYLPWAAS